MSLYLLIYSFIDFKNRLFIFIIILGGKSLSSRVCTILDHYHSHQSVQTCLSFAARLQWIIYTLTQWHVVKHIKNCTCTYVECNNMKYAVLKQVKIQHKWHWRGDELSINCVWGWPTVQSGKCTCTYTCVSHGQLNRQNHFTKDCRQWSALLYKQCKKCVYS